MSEFHEPDNVDELLRQVARTNQEIAQSLLRLERLAASHIAWDRRFKVLSWIFVLLVVFAMAALVLVAIFADVMDWLPF